ncbi:MAG: hypothetical protein A3F90_05890 [Deltaproteobacteria bacterium RIFCSPLOWO2_12_FULL_60_19]|nr:MAG: hypothetical protein A3F90_05890 [Deltaproteobacteria bacterium RIFCSPLOWO2_12_FULL_60_19]
MRLVTRADFDGVVCGALVTLMEDAVDSFLFVEPKFMQDGMVDIHPGDIIANLPYHPNCTLWFDHHITNAPAWEKHIRVPGSGFRVPGSQPPTPNSQFPVIVPGKGGFRIAPSAARVVYEYYTSVANHESRVASSPPQNPTPDTRHPTPDVLNSDRIKFLLEETDKIDAALLTREDVLNPQGYVLISMTIDGKRPEDEPYWMKLIELLREASLEQTLADPEIARRCRQILDDQEKLKKILLARTALRGNVIVTDLRGVKDLPDGNRFLLYTLFPGSNISLKIGDDSQRANATAISVGYNIFNTTSKVNVGALMEKHGGGGHHVVGSCRVPKREAEKHIREIFEAIRE